MTGIEKMVRALEVQVKEAKQSMEDCREYGVNSVGFNAYMGQMEMAETMLEEARRLAAEEANEKPAPDLWGQHKQMVKMAQDNGLHLAANWAVNMSGKTFSEKVIADEAQKRYYNECARNSVLYDLGATLISELEKHDPNNPILDKAEEQLEGNGYSLGRPVETPSSPASLEEELRGVIQQAFDLRVSGIGISVIQNILSRYRPSKTENTEPLAVLAKRKGFNEVMWSEYPQEFGVSVRNFNSGVEDLQVFGGKDYSSAEAKAREYLNGLPDKADKEGK